MPIPGLRLTSRAPSAGSDQTPALMRRRIVLVYILFVVAFARLALHLMAIQVLPDRKFTREDMKHIGEVTIQVPRGSIYDRNGVLLATDRPAPSLWVDPQEMADPAGTAQRLAGPLGLPVDEVYRRLVPASGPGGPMKFVWVKRWLSESEFAAVRASGVLEDGGVSVRMEPVRFYPQRELASHVVGFVNRERVGSEGVEMSFDGYLRSTAGRRVARADRKRLMLESLTLEYKEPEGGDNVRLTIDTAIQDALERGLSQAVEENRAVRASGILMDPRTGAILALACVPAYDPNRFSEVDAALLKNRALVDVFEPGSAFKVVTASGALEEKLVNPSYPIDCEGGSFNPYGHRIKDVHKMGVAPFSMCFAESSNIAMIKVGAMLGPERLETWIRRFGFGERTSSDFTTETAGIFRPRSKWSRLSMGSLPMGQEIAVSMLQLARAYAVVANGGFLVDPYVVESCVSRDGVLTYVHETPEPRRVLSDPTARTMQALCHLVVTHGTGSKANIPEYRVGGKTGTAQVARTDGPGYYPDRYTAIFCGFAPVREPWLVGVIVVHEPRVRIYGGSVSAPVFQRVVREALIMMHCPEDPVQEKVNSGAAEPDDPDVVMARNEATLQEPVQDMLAPLDLLRLGPMAPPPPVSASVLGEPTLPSLVGMTKRQALDELRGLGIEADVDGTGWVVWQDPPAGTALGDVLLCHLLFRSKSEATDAPARSTDTPGA